MQNQTERFAAAKYIKEIGRGKEGARSMSEEQAQELYGAMLDGRVSDLEMGGILLAMRIKGETIDEIHGFLAAAEKRMQLLHAPIDSEFAPVIIPSYNGARKRPNLTPLLAMLLARKGVPVLLHGVKADLGRVASADIWRAMGTEFANNAEEANQQLEKNRLSFITIEVLAPAMHRLLEMRRVLGLRNSTHTLVKVLQPFIQPALRLTSYTHPEYQVMLDGYFTQKLSSQRGAAFLMRGTEGETVASTGRAQQITAYFQGAVSVLQEPESQLTAEHEDLPQTISAEDTARWMKQVLDGERVVPSNIANQIEHILKTAKAIKQQVN
ncbi:DNA-binding protein YbiB [Undibacterium sp. LX40W]|uniref:DNA-binding protein YbiB n=1 Tax=Undibacterium nitidum TaxID=2762298 RepID=A0A923HP37_9BURK|nr:MULTISPECIES: DNA-binding protein YbiB [Undibacterium]MBC3881273.1 DNA-binding protein YbiB [Undibacterium nitidum]MBC3891944.1 DNA-binding protein YbiB [Undibacterium sp. LX40W]